MDESEAKSITKAVTKEFDAKFIHHLVFWAQDIHGNEITWCQRYSEE